MGMKCKQQQRRRGIEREAFHDGVWATIEAVFRRSGKRKMGREGKWVSACFGIDARPVRFRP
jgi:hypothetical protein